MRPSPKHTVQVQRPKPPQLRHCRAESGSTSVLISPPPPHAGQPIFLNPLHSGHSTNPPCIQLTSSQQFPQDSSPIVYHLSEESARKKYGALGSSASFDHHPALERLLSHPASSPNGACREGRGVPLIASEAVRRSGHRGPLGGDQGWIPARTRTVERSSWWLQRNLGLTGVVIKNRIDCNKYYMTLPGRPWHNERSTNGWS